MTDCIQMLDVGRRRFLSGAGIAAAGAMAVAVPARAVGVPASLAQVAYPSRLPNEFVIPNFKSTWGGIRRIASALASARALSFKSWGYSS